MRTFLIEDFAVLDAEDEDAIIYKIMDYCGIKNPYDVDGIGFIEIDKTLLHAEINKVSGGLCFESNGYVKLKDITYTNYIDIINRYNIDMKKLGVSDEC